jgi:hypothetical protein
VLSVTVQLLTCVPTGEQKTESMSLSVGTKLAKHPASLETVTRIYAAFVIVSSWCELRTACAVRFLM